MKNRIEKDDRVLVVFASDGSSLRGVVDYTPQATGDSWVIVQDDGTVNYVQMFETMQLVGKPNAGGDASAYSPIASTALLSVPSNTIVTCANCGNEYEVHYTEPFDKAGEGRRICVDCCEGLGPEDLPCGISTDNN